MKGNKCQNENKEREINLKYSHNIYIHNKMRYFNEFLKYSRINL